MTTAASLPALPPTVLGYPRIGPNREIKKALEAHWSGGGVTDLITAISQHRHDTAEHLSQLGLETDSSVPFDGAVIDQVLDASVLLGLVPRRFRDAGFRDVDPDSAEGLGLISALARGTDELEPLELTKWFDTNYHYYVPEIESENGFSPQAEALATRFRGIVDAAGSVPRPCLLGPISFLLLAKSIGQHARFDRLAELDRNSVV